MFYIVVPKTSKKRHPFHFIAVFTVYYCYNTGIQYTEYTMRQIL